MNAAGLWKVKEALTYNEDGDGVWRSAEDILADESLGEGNKQMARAKFLFEADGSFKTLFALPASVTQEEIDAAVAAGEAELYDARTMVAGKTRWKEENGRIFVDTGISGTILDEAVDPWIELQETEDGFIYMAYKLVRA